MGPLNPPPPAEEPPSAQKSSALGTILFGAAFLLLSALIFTLAFRFPHTAPPPPAPAPEPVVAAAPPPPPTMPTLPLTYPASRTVDASDTFFNTKVADPYRWLEDGQSPEVQTWLQAQNQLARSYLDPLPGRDKLEQRYHDLLYIDTISTPQRAGDRLFYMKKKSSDEKAILYWRSTYDSNAPENVLVDPNQYVGTNNASLGDWVPAHDGGLIAYTLKPNNADEATLYIRDVTTGKDIPGQVIEGAKYADPSWLPDGSGFVYTWLPPAEPGHVEDRPGLAVVRYHEMWSDPKNDPVIHPKTGDATKFIGAGISRDGKWIFFIQENGWSQNDLWYQPLHGKPTAALAKSWKELAVGKPNSYSIEAWNGQGYLLTNEGASHFRVFRVDLDNPRRSRWHEIIPESPTTVLQGVSVIGNHLVTDEIENVTGQVGIHDLEGKLLRHLKLPGPGSVGAISGIPERDELFYNFVNFTTPSEIFQTSVSAPGETLWGKVSLPIDTSSYVVDQKFFPSKDGTKIPIFIVHHKDIMLDGRTPFLLTGYGGFAVSNTPYFSAGYYPWLEAGGGYALVNLRGGGEYGEKWHQDGMLLKKQNVFDDCIAAAQYLISAGYTKADRLAFRGGSNGGLLAGAMFTQRPDLFRAIVCEVPLLDMIRYDRFGSGKTWVPEYGSPRNKAQFQALYAYSPYHHVTKGTKYPSILLCTAANDDRVDPMHARKMAAELQAATGGPNPILLRVESQSGHGGGDQVKKNVEYGTDVYGFLMHEFGMQMPDPTVNNGASH